MPPSVATLEDIFSRKIVRGECWLYSWSAKSRYPVVCYKGVQYKVHVLMYKSRHKNFVPGKPVCHTCDEPWCFRPKHLVQRTQAWNVRDAAKKKRLDTKSMTESRRNQMFCHRGHPLFGKNVYRYPNRKKRQCRMCKKINARQRDAVGIGLFANGVWS